MEVLLNSYMHSFFVRVIKIVNDFHLKNVGIGFFTNARFFAGGNYWQKFNNKFFSKFKFIKGTMLNAGEFSDTSNTWPIVFATYKYQVGGRRTCYRQSFIRTKKVCLGRRKR